MKPVSSQLQIIFNVLKDYDVELSSDELVGVIEDLKKRKSVWLLIDKILRKKGKLLSR